MIDSCIMLLWTGNLSSTLTLHLFVSPPLETAPSQPSICPNRRLSLRTRRRRRRMRGYCPSWTLDRIVRYSRASGCGCDSETTAPSRRRSIWQCVSSPPTRRSRTRPQVTVEIRWHHSMQAQAPGQVVSGFLIQDTKRRNNTFPDQVAHTSRKRYIGRRIRRSFGRGVVRMRQITRNVIWVLWCCARSRSCIVLRFPSSRLACGVCALMELLPVTPVMPPPHLMVFNVVSAIYEQVLHLPFRPPKVIWSRGVKPWLT